MTFQKTIKTRRKEINLTQEEVADKLFVSRPTISNWETGKTFPDIESLIALSNLYDISLDELIKGDKQIQKKIKIKNNYESGLMVLGFIFVVGGFWLPNGLSMLVIIVGYLCILFGADISKYINNLFNK